MDKTRPKGAMPTDTDDVGFADIGDEKPLAGGRVKGSFKGMRKNSDAEPFKEPVRKHPPLTAVESDPDSHFEGDGYSVRRLPDDEARRVLAGREGVVAHQDSTEEFLAFLRGQPAAGDADPR